MNIPKSHPRYSSLRTRQLLEKGVKLGITSLNGLIAQGRGEAFDYLLGEKTHEFAIDALNAASASFIVAQHPVISVNGNTAALVPNELIQLSNILTAPLEINLFHSSEERIKKIKLHLQKYGAKKILLPNKNCVIPFLESDRRFVNPNGIFAADVVFVPLEDGDRTEALIKNGKKVITIDLNPLSRTAQKATITIVDNIVRAMPQLLVRIKTDKKQNPQQLLFQLENYANSDVLSSAVQSIRQSY